MPPKKLYAVIIPFAILGLACLVWGVLDEIQSGWMRRIDVVPIVGGGFFLVWAWNLFREDSQMY